MKTLKDKRGFFVFLFLLSVLATMLGVFFTQGRYSEEISSDSGIYGGNFEYIVAEKVEVESVEELIAAVENGYSNITIADSVEDPLIITSGVTDVGSDLILDLNGHEIQRNNRNPMLNITDGVRMTVIDSSSAQTGSFYNPVGSVLEISGGTLTVTGGDFVSGPKKSEYANAGNGFDSDSGGALRAGVVGFLRTLDTSTGEYTEAREATVPRIEPTVTPTAAAVFVNGNMYLEEAPTDDFGGLLESDAYLYYVTDEEGVIGNRIAANGSADFIYSYDDGGNGITVYGYYSVKDSATAETNYATIRMSAGNMYARGGDYYSYFGKSDAYGIYAQGGYMAVGAGSSFEAIEAGTCVACNYSGNSAEEYLRIGGGSFVSDYGDTVRVSGGRTVVSGGSFEKVTTGAGDGNKGSAAIRVTGGELDASSSAALSFNVVGSDAYGIYVSGGSAAVTHSEFTFTPSDGGSLLENVTGIYAESGASSGSVSVSDTSLVFGAESASYMLKSATGIGAAGGKVEAYNVDVHIHSASDDNADDRGGNGNRGILATNGSVSLKGDCNVTVDGSYSVGVYASVTAQAAGGEGSGISYSEPGESGLKVEMNGSVAQKTGSSDNALTSTAVSTDGGNISFDGKVTITSDGLGMTAQSTVSGGDITFGTESGTAYEYDVTTTNGTAVYVNGGNIYFRSGTVNIVSEIYSKDETAAGAYKWNGATAFYDGICVQGGSLDARGATLNVTHKGIENDYSGAYNELVVNSYAVRVMSPDSGSATVSESKVYITKGELTNTVGGGLYVGTGSSGLDAEVTLGNENDGDENIKISAAGDTNDKVANGDHTPIEIEGANANWAYKKNIKGGHAVEVVGGTLNIYSGTYDAVQGNGILVSGGEANISGGKFTGADVYKNNEGGSMPGAAASYALKMYGGILTVTGGEFGSAKADGSGEFGSAEADGSGAFIMGTIGARASANIYGGSFNVGGTAGLSVYAYADIALGKNAPNSTADSTAVDVSMSGTSAGITIESGATDAEVNIYSGEYFCNMASASHNSDGIWYSESSAQLNIRGGTFVGGRYIEGSRASSAAELIQSGKVVDANAHDAAGLFFDKDPGKNVQVYAGDFYGGNARVDTGAWGVDVYVRGGAFGVKGSANWGSYNGVEVNVDDIISADSNYDHKQNNVSLHSSFSQYNEIHVWQ